MKVTRISLNLIHYFQDHRQLAKICVKNDMETISDLEKHIAVTFNIEKHFYLMCQNHYLPSSENIHLLSDNDVVYVLPNVQSSSTHEKSMLCKKSKQEKYNLTTEQLGDYEASETDLQINGGYMKKRKQKNVCISPTQTENALKETKGDENTMEVVIDDESAMEVVKDEESKKKPKKRKRHVPSPDENEVMSQTELSKNNCEEKPKNICFNVPEEIDVSSVANNEKMNTNQGIHEEVKKLSKTRMSLVEHVEKLTSGNGIESILNVNASKRKYYSLNDIIDFKSDTNANPLNINRTVSCTDKITPAEEIVASSNAIINESDQLIDFNAEDSKVFVTKRRRIRKRNRKSKSDNPVQDNALEIPVFVPPKSQAAPKYHVKFTDEDVQINPDETFQDIINGESTLNNFTGQYVAHSTPHCKKNTTMKLFELSEPKKCNFEMRTVLFKNLLSKLNVAACFPVEAPQIGDVIIFKKLKIGNDYTPQISDYILAAVKETDGTHLKVSVLDGRKELEEPKGKFSCAEENGDAGDFCDDIVVVERDSLIDPKIVTSEAILMSLNN